MKQSTLARYVVGAAVVLAIWAALWGPGQGGIEGSFITADSYEAGADPVSLFSSLGILAVYVWVLSQPADPTRRSVSAGMWRRFFAFYIDFLFAVLMSACWMGFTELSIEAARTGVFSWSIHRRPTDWDIALGWILLLPYITAILVYFAWPQHRGRQSPGDLLLGIGLKYDKPLSLSQAVGRVLLGLMALSAWIVTVPLALTDSQKRMWQDKSYGTRMVQWTD